MYLKDFALVTVLWLAFQIKVARAQCGGYSSLGYDASLSVSNAEYPSYYYPQSYCKWEIESPGDTLLSVSCSDINIPTVDNFYFYTTGRRAETIQDKRSNSVLHEVWQSNKLTIELPFTQGSGRFSCHVQVVATGTTTTTTTEYSNPEPSCDCGWRYQRRIVGGVETGVNEFPFMAGIASQAAGGIICGGAIISEWFVLTAAHCVDTTYFGELYVVAGEHNVLTGSDTDVTAVYVIEDRYTHPGYNNVTYENDIAIIKTKLQIKFSLAVGPVCLPFNFYQADGFFDVLALGWGSEAFSDPTSPYLQKVDLHSVTNDECRQKMTQYPIYPSQMCVYGNGKDTCTYDSGGPLIWYDNSVDRYKLVGLTSYGQSCGSQYPSVNTRVSSYGDFIFQYTAYNMGHGFCMM